MLLEFTIQKPGSSKQAKCIKCIVTLKDIQDGEGEITCITYHICTPLQRFAVALAIP